MSMTIKEKKKAVTFQDFFFLLKSHSRGSSCWREGGGGGDLTASAWISF